MNEGKRRGAIYAVIALSIVVGASFATALVAATPTGAPSAPPAPALRPLGAPPNGALLDTPTYRAAVNAQLSKFLSQSYVASVPSAAATAAQTAARLLAQTPSQVLAEAGLGTAYNAVNLTASLLVPDSAFASWQSYLYEAGVGCLAGVGGTYLAGGLGSALGFGSYETVTVAGAVGGPTAVATDVTPATFVLGCAIGAAVNLVIFQNLVDEGAAINYAGLLGNFEIMAASAYANYLNLTAAMYSSLGSLLTYAQVGFDRAADNAALLQIQNQSFNTGLDLLQSGIAAQLGTLPTSMEYQFAQDYYTIPQLENGFGAPSAYYGGYGCLYYVSTATGTYGPCYLAGNGVGSAAELSLGASATDVYTNASAPGVGPAYNATFAGWAMGDTCGTTGGYFCGADGIIIPNPRNPILYGNGGAAASLLFSSPTKNGTPEAWLNSSTGTPGGGVPAVPVMPTSECNWFYGPGRTARYNAALGEITTQVGCPLPTGIYNVTSPSQSDQSVIIPMASQVPSLTTKSLGTFDWAIRYTQTSGGATFGVNCGITSAAGNVPFTVGSDAGPGLYYTAGTVPTASYVTGFVHQVGFGIVDVTGATCAYTSGDSAFIGPVSSQDTTTVSNNLGTYNPQVELSATIAGVEVNATQSANAYWAFLHTNLGFTSLSQVPADCIIPAPYMAVPSNANLGALNLNQTEALYQAFLRGMGNFYGSSSAFSVCSGPVENPYSWLSLSEVNFTTQAYGAAYLDNGTAAVNVSGKALAGEALTNTSTWALAACRTASTTNVAPLGKCPDGKFTADPGSVASGSGASKVSWDNATLIPVPLLSSIAVPVGKTWPVPASDPTMVFYAVQNTTTAPGKGNWTMLQTALLSGNGTATGATDAYGATTPGDSLYLTACDNAGKWVATCDMNLTSFSAYIASIICPSGTNITAASNGAAVCIAVAPPSTGTLGGTATCGMGVFFLGSIVNAFDGLLGGGNGLLGAIVCPIAWVLGIVVTVVIFIAAIVIVVAGVRLGADLSRRREG